MISLRELQSRFLGAVLSGDDMPVASLIDADGMDPSDRLGVCRNNVFHNFCEALRDVYPVVERLVGEEFFTHAARQYIRAHPSTSGDIHQFGRSFPEFVEAFCPTLAYLGDTARLEWAWHQVFHAADHVPLSLARLAQVPAASYPSLRFNVHPAARLVSSPYPIHRIWASNQPQHDSGEVIDLSAGGANLLVRRERGGYSIAIEPLDAGDYTLLTELARANTLAHAVAQACEVCPDFDLASRMRYHVQSGTLVGFSIADEASV